MSVLPEAPRRAIVGGGSGLARLGRCRRKGGEDELFVLLEGFGRGAVFLRSLLEDLRGGETLLTQLPRFQQLALHLAKCSASC